VFIDFECTHVYLLYRSILPQTWHLSNTLANYIHTRVQTCGFYKTIHWLLYCDVNVLKQIFLRVIIVCWKLWLWFLINLYLNGCYKNQSADSTAWAGFLMSFNYYSWYWYWMLISCPHQHFSICTNVKIHSFNVPPWIYSSLLWTT